MKYFVAMLAFYMYIAPNNAQVKNFIDQPFLETRASVDTLVVPDEIFLTIVLNESDSKNKRSTEELEQDMRKVLEANKIDLAKNLSLLDISSNFKKYFLSDQKVLKTKMYSLKLEDAITTGKVISGLEKVDISNVSVEKVNYSKTEELISQLKSKAIRKAQKNAESLVQPLGQEVGPAIYISDLHSMPHQFERKTTGIQIRGASSLYGNKANDEPLAVDFNKIKFSTNILVKFKIE